MRNSFEALFNPSKLWTREEILNNLSLVPNKSGLYVWYFDCLQELVPIDGCIQVNDLYLLYCGICPKAPVKGKQKGSKRTLRARIIDHYCGNAYGSTLRLSLGCLLSKELGIRLQRSAGSKRMTFGDGENILSKWMEKNAYIVWMLDPKPWKREEDLIKKAKPPLNLLNNKEHPFYKRLKKIRSLCKENSIVV